MEVVMLRTGVLGPSAGGKSGMVGRAMRSEPKSKAEADMVREQWRKRYEREGAGRTRSISPFLLNYPLSLPIELSFKPSFELSFEISI